MVPARPCLTTPIARVVSEIAFSGQTMEQVPQP
jgi:hypothetical protein